MAQFIIEHVEGRWQVFSFNVDLVQQQFPLKTKFFFERVYEGNWWEVIIVFDKLK